jgi:ribosomal protein S12 methylthiotransferase
LDVIATEQRAVKYLDMPLQHASAKVLKLMRRGGTRAGLERLIKRVRERVPDIAIRTTFITGYPGETESDFAELLNFVRAMEFDHVGVFTYSDEEGTHAFDLPDKVDARTMKRRRDLLMREQRRISRRRKQMRVGKTVRVLFEGVAKETDLLWQGRMETQAPDIDGCVLINDAPEDFQPIPGQFVKVLIMQAHDYDLVGRIV